MSNKIKSQQQQQQQQHHPHQAQQVITHAIKSGEALPPRYQPPPPPPLPPLLHLSAGHQQPQTQIPIPIASQPAAVSGILKNHPSFVTGTPISNSTSIANVTGTATSLSPPQPTGQLRMVLQSKDGHGKFPGRSESSHHPTSVSLTPATKSHQGSYPQSKSQFQPLVNNLPPPRQKLTDEEFLGLSPIEMLKFVRKTESDIARLAAEQNRQIQNLMSELRTLKEANQRLSDDNQELRDLCCFLDDDRQKGRKLAREWQRFGRYTASVMRQEVSAYQNKLRQLDNKQQELIKDNLELKELCLYLDEERGGAQRDDGDGSSSSTNAEETALLRPRHVSIFNDQTMQYVRSLEQRVKQLEEDKSMLQARVQGWETMPGETWEKPNSPITNNNLSGRPEAVVRALQVLEVREQVEKEGIHDGEKALVRELCNVVWRKLEEGPQARH